MAELRTTFKKGKMDKDIDERLMTADIYQHAENISIHSLLGGGTISPAISTTLIKDYALTNATCISAIADESQSMIYYLITSDEFDLVIEYSKLLGTSVVLKDTKGRVLKFSNASIITGINIISTGELSLKQLAWTDGINPPRKIYIESAKSFGLDGFEEEDISVVRRPPVAEPEIEYFHDDTIVKNKLENVFGTFSYRYIYEGNEYSSNSFYSRTTNIVIPSNSYSSMNVIDVTVNSGDFRVIGFDILYKEASSSNVYIIKHIDKNINSVADDFSYVFRFDNQDIYPVLSIPQSQLIYNNVPLLAETQDFIGNRLVYFNYTENYNLEDSLGDDIIPNYTLTKGYDALASDSLTVSSTPAVLYVDSIIDFTGKTFTKGQSIELEVGRTFLAYVYDVSLLTFVVPNDYANITAMYNDTFHDWLVEAFMKGGYMTTGYSALSFTLTGNTVVIAQSGGVVASVAVRVFMAHIYDSFTLTYKSEVSHEFGIKYYDDYNRSSPVVATLNNDVVFPSLVEGDNRVGTEIGKVDISIFNKPPYWATKYKIVRKSNQHNYDITRAVDLYNYVYDARDDYYMSLDENQDLDMFKVGGLLNLRLKYGYDVGVTVEEPVFPVAKTIFEILAIGAKDEIYPLVDPIDPEYGISDIMIHIRPVSGALDGFESKDLFMIPATPSTVTGQKYSNMYFYVEHEEAGTLDFYYEIPETHLITNGIHEGTTQSQSVDYVTPAITSLVDGDTFYTGLPLERYKIKDDFNGVEFENVEKIRPSAVSDIYKKNIRMASITYSDVFDESSSFNGLSTFNLTVGNYKDLDTKYGAINIGIGSYGDIFIAQEHKLSTVLFNKDVLSNADGTGNIVSTTNVLGNQVYIASDNGISNHPESFVSYDNFIIFTDAYRGDILMIQGKDFVKISDLGMSSYLNDLLISNPNVSHIGAYNPDTDEYILSINGTTVAYSIADKGWSTFYSYVPDIMTYMNGVFYSFKDSVLYSHNNKALYNNFYGVQYASRIISVLNGEQSDTNIYNSINLESTHAWNIDYSTEMTDGGILATEFERKDNEWYAYLRRNEDIKDTSSMSTQGIGIVTAVNSTIISFVDVPYDVNNGDNLYIYNSIANNLTHIGLITAHTATTLSLSSVINPIIIGDFAVCVKNSRIEGSAIRGNYLKLDMILNNSTVSELFAVTVDSSKSFQ